MRLADSTLASTWHAQLHLAYERRGDRTVLAARRHDGPLVVQKPLYPEGDAVCHSIIVHPPAGIAGGDTLELDARVGADAHALLTTPGAGKWYRSAGLHARQMLWFGVDPGATLEWLPQESIVFDGALAEIETTVQLASNASYIGWDILCLGRTGSGERFTRGTCGLRTQIRRAGKLVWFERGDIVGGDRLLSSAVGLGGMPVCGTLVAIGPKLDDSLRDQCRTVSPTRGTGALTRLPDVLLARYVGDSSEAARAYFAAIWSIVRPALIGRAAALPRIWRT
jgi:urease accessory protein